MLSAPLGHTTGNGTLRLYGCVCSWRHTTPRLRNSSNSNSNSFISIISIIISSVGNILAASGQSGSSIFRSSLAFKIAAAATTSKQQPSCPSQQSTTAQRIDLRRSPSQHRVSPTHRFFDIIFIATRRFRPHPVCKGFLFLPPFSSSSHRAQSSNGPRGNLRKRTKINPIAETR